ncbi:MAG: hypothetical protein HOW73_46205 [Polyangiaceae bacterium]|nr:hypothetical protein [Polyangiaceae bacterium]
MFARARTSGCLALLLVGCTVIGGVDEFRDEVEDKDCPGQPCEGPLCPEETCPSDDPDGSTGIGGQGPSADPDEVPEGWIGPVKHNVSTTEPTCTAPYSLLIAVGHTSVSALPADCSTCSCESSGCAATLSFWQGMDDCQDGCAGSRTLTPSTCVDVGTVPSCPSDHPKYSATAVTVTAPDCAPSSQQPELPEVTWTTVSTVCLATDADASSGRCIARAGDVECPVSFPARAVLYRTIVDTRGCTECGCTPGSCAGTVELYDGNGCGVGQKKASVAVPFADGCQTIGGNPRALYTPDSSADCIPIPSTPTGGVTLRDPYTVCCG